MFKHLAVKSAQGFACWVLQTDHVARLISNADISEHTGGHILVHTVLLNWLHIVIIGNVPVAFSKQKVMHGRIKTFLKNEENLLKEKRRKQTRITGENSHTKTKEEF